MAKSRNLKIRIGGDELELSNIEEIPVSITYLSEDASEFQRKKSSEAFSIEVPATLKNDLISNTFHNPSIEDLTQNEEFKNFRDAVIEANGYELLVGKALLISAKYDSRPVSYTYDFYGNNGDWLIPLREATLYDFLKSISFQFTKEHIMQSWAFDGTDPDLPYVFAPVRYGQQMEKVKMISSTTICCQFI